MAFAHREGSSPGGLSPGDVLVHHPPSPTLRGNGSGRGVTAPCPSPASLPGSRPGEEDYSPSHVGPSRSEELPMPRHAVLWLTAFLCWAAGLRRPLRRLPPTQTHLPRPGTAAGSRTPSAPAGTTLPRAARSTRSPGSRPWRTRLSPASYSWTTQSVRPATRAGRAGQSPRSARGPDGRLHAAISASLACRWSGSIVPPAMSASCTRTASPPCGWTAPPTCST